MSCKKACMFGRSTECSSDFRSRVELSAPNLPTRPVATESAARTGPFWVLDDASGQKLACRPVHKLFPLCAARRFHQPCWCAQTTTMAQMGCLGGEVHILERPDCRDVSFSANTSAEIQTNILRCFPDGRVGCRDGACLEQVFRTYNSSPLQEVRKKLYFTRARVVQPSSCPCFDHTCTSFSLGWCENPCDPCSQRLPETGFRRARESESSQINTFPTHRAFS